jgi:hypothetical protein
MILEISAVNDIVCLVDRIHDLFFNLEEFGAQQGATRTFELREDPRSFNLIEWVRMGFGSKGAQGRNNSQPPFEEWPFRSLMRVFGVISVIINDTEHVGLYDINTIEYEPPWIKVVTGIPLGLRMEVSELRIQLLSGESPEGIHGD